MTFENLLLERDGAVAIVTLNRPKVLNALNNQTLAELSACMATLKADESVRAIILTGAGEKSFVAGADLNELATQSPVEGQAHARRGQFDRQRDTIELLTDLSHSRRVGIMQGKGGLNRRRAVDKEANCFHLGQIMQL